MYVLIRFNDEKVRSGVAVVNGITTKIPSNFLILGKKLWLGICDAVCYIPNFSAIGGILEYMVNNSEYSQKFWMLCACHSLIDIPTSDTSKSC